MALSRRTLATVICIALVLTAGVALAAHISGTVPTSGSVPMQAPDGMTVFVEGDTNQLLEENFPTSGTVEVIAEEGNATFFSSGSANATVQADEIEGDWTNTTSIDADPNSITINPDDKDSAIVAQEVTAFNFTSVTVDDGAADFVYEGATGQSEVTVQGVPGDSSIRARDVDSGNILEYSDSNSGGAVTFDTLPDGEHTVVLQVAEPDAPTLTNPQPTGGVESPPGSFTIDVNDTEFPSGDSVTAELFVEGNSEGSDTLTSNGTASVSFAMDLGTSYDYHWEAEDSFGETTTTSTFTTFTPENVTIREETNASEVVTGADTTITLYSTDAEIVVERTDSNNDGNISMEGLPDKEFVAVVDADDHYTRRVYIQSIYEQQNIFVLNQTEVPGDRAINTTFTFEDRTGNFNPESSTLRVQRALDINDDGEFEWMTVAGDFWGAASEFPFTGEVNARYRLIAENEEGDRRVLGTHIPVDDGVKNIVNGEIRFEAENATGRYFDANLSQSEENIQVLYQDPTDGTGDIRIRVWELGNRSNEIHDQNYTNSPYGRLLTTVDLTSDQAEQSWVVRYDTTHDEDGEIGGQVPVGEGIGVTLPADPWLLAAFGVIGLTMIGTLYGPRTYLIGSWVLVVSAAGMTAFGILAVPWPGIVVAVAIAAGGTFYKEALP